MSEQDPVIAMEQHANRPSLDMATEGRSFSFRGLGAPEPYDPRPKEGEESVSLPATYDGGTIDGTASLVSSVHYLPLTGNEDGTTTVASTVNNLPLPDNDDGTATVASTIKNLPTISLEYNQFKAVVDRISILSEAVVEIHNELNITKAELTSTKVRLRDTESTVEELRSMILNAESNTHKKLNDLNASIEQQEEGLKNMLVYSMIHKATSVDPASPSEQTSNTAGGTLETYPLSRSSSLSSTRSSSDKMDIAIKMMPLPLRKDRDVSNGSSDAAEQPPKSEMNLNHQKDSSNKQIPSIPPPPPPQSSEKNETIVVTSKAGEWSNLQAQIQSAHSNLETTSAHRKPMRVRSMVVKGSKNESEEFKKSHHSQESNGKSALESKSTHRKPKSRRSLVVKGSKDESEELKKSLHRRRSRSKDEIEDLKKSQHRRSHVVKVSKDKSEELKKSQHRRSLVVKGSKDESEDLKNSQHRWSLVVKEFKDETEDLKKSQHSTETTTNRAPRKSRSRRSSVKRTEEPKLESSNHEKTKGLSKSQRRRRSLVRPSKHEKEEQATSEKADTDKSSTMIQTHSQDEKLQNTPSDNEENNPSSNNRPVMKSLVKRVSPTGEIIYALEQSKSSDASLKDTSTVKPPSQTSLVKRTSSKDESDGKSDILEKHPLSHKSYCSLSSENDSQIESDAAKIAAMEKPGNDKPPKPLGRKCLVKGIPYDASDGKSDVLENPRGMKSFVKRLSSKNAPQIESDAANVPSSIRRIPYESEDEEGTGKSLKSTSVKSTESLMSRISAKGELFTCVFPGARKKALSDDPW